MQQLEEQYSFLTSGRGYVSRKHDGDKLFVFERGGLLWIFNFHPTKVCDQRTSNSLEMWRAWFVHAMCL